MALYKQTRYDNGFAIGWLDSSTTHQFIDEAGTHSVSTQPGHVMEGRTKCSGKCESCTGAASGAGGCAGSATYESSILFGSTIWALCVINQHS